MLHGASGWHLAVAQWWSRVDHVTGERSGVVARKTTRSTGMGLCSMAFGSCIWAAQIHSVWHYYNRTHTSHTGSFIRAADVFPRSVWRVGKPAARRGLVLQNTVGVWEAAAPARIEILYRALGAATPQPGGSGRREPRKNKAGDLAGGRQPPRALLKGLYIIEPKPTRPHSSRGGTFLFPMHVPQPCWLKLSKHRCDVAAAHRVPGVPMQLYVVGGMAGRSAAAAVAAAAAAAAAAGAATA